jgi:hypothetical protein
VFEIPRWNGAAVRVAFPIDPTIARSSPGPPACAGIAGIAVRDLMLLAVERRFAALRIPFRHLPTVAIRWSARWWPNGWKELRSLRRFPRSALRRAGQEGRNVERPSPAHSERDEAFPSLLAICESNTDQTTTSTTICAKAAISGQNTPLIMISRT